MKKKKTTYSLHITEGSTVEARLQKDNHRLLHFVDPKGTPARICYQVPDKTLLRDRMLYHAAHDSSHPSLASQVDFYIRSRDREIRSNMIDIRKCIRRIIKNIECVSLANAIQKEAAEQPLSPR